MKRELAERALSELCDTIEATGGVVERDGGYVPAEDEDWVDLGSAYVLACQALGRPAMVVLGDDDDDEDDSELDLEGDE